MQRIIWTWFCEQDLLSQLPRFALAPGSHLVANMKLIMQGCKALAILAQRGTRLTGAARPRGPCGFGWGFARSAWQFVFTFCLIPLPPPSQVFIPNKCPMGKIPSQGWLSENPTCTSGQRTFQIQNKLTSCSHFIRVINYREQSETLHVTGLYRIFVWPDSKLLNKYLWYVIEP